MSGPLRLALQGGVVRHVDDVAQGLACDCVCPSCGEALIARQGRTVVSHFAHRNDSDCAGAPETALHLAAKHAIARRRTLRVPPITLQFPTRRPPSLLRPATDLTFRRVELESAFQAHSGLRVVDAVGPTGDGDLIVEIRVTHAVDPGKLADLEGLGLPVIEIDLSMVPRDLPPWEIERVVIGDQSPRNLAGVDRAWLCHPLEVEARKTLLASARRLPVIVRGSGAHHVDWCPREHWRFKPTGVPYANVHIHCRECPDFLGQPSGAEILCAGQSPTPAPPSPPSPQLDLF